MDIHEFIDKLPPRKGAVKELRRIRNNLGILEYNRLKKKFGKIPVE